MTKLKEKLNKENKDLNLINSKIGIDFKSYFEIKQYNPKFLKNLIKYLKNE